MNSLRIWLRLVRLRFLTASVVAVTLGLVISYRRFQLIDPLNAAITYCGVIALHASIDILNDYADYVSGIDLDTKRTPLSGGTGVLPEGLIAPRHAYWAGLILLSLGSLAGIYLSIFKGPIILGLLIFAALSVYFYSTKLVNWGFGEILLILKGMTIVLGTFYVQTQLLALEPIYVGVILGVLSASVLFINQFPDFQADRAHARRNLVVRLGRPRAAKAHVAFHTATYLMIATGVILGLMPVLALLSLLSVPLAVRVARGLRRHHDEPSSLVVYMVDASRLARLIGLLIVLSYLVPI
jgi:1,4-dihydroxy-2-naphthoate octaprenyltransferase